MRICDEIISAFMQSSSIFSNLNEFNRFSANDTHGNVKHAFYISPYPDGIINIKGKNFFTISFSLEIRYLHIEQLIENILGDLYPSGCPSVVLNLSDGFPEEHLYSHRNYLIDVSSAAAQKKSIQEFIEKYYKWIEPVRQKMRSIECLADFEFCPSPERNTLSWELRRLAYLYLYEKNILNNYIKHFKEDFVPYVQELDMAEAELTEEDMDFWSAKEDKLVNLELHTIRRSVEQVKKMLSALEKYQENAV